ncbi:hypothetical protein Tco_1173825 [Tanacetum coccineum]
MKQEGLKRKRRNSSKDVRLGLVLVMYLREYEIWEIRIKQYVQIQDYALWEVIENGNSWVPIPVTSPAETGTSTGTKMTVPSTAEGKTCKKNDVKARSLLLMVQPNEHQLTFDQLQRLVSRLAILGVVTPLEDLNKVKKSAGASNDDKNLAFVTTSGSQLVHEDLEQLHDDDLKEMNLKWNMMALMTEEEIQENMALMAFSDFEVTNDKSCIKNYEAIKKQYDDLLVKLDDTGFKAATYKRGLATLEEQIIKYREHEVLFSEEIALLKRSVGLEEFKEPEVNEYGPRDSSLKPTIGCDKELDNSKENTDDSLEQHQITDTETSSVRSSLKVDKDWKEKFF